MTLNVTSLLYQHNMVGWEYAFPPKTLIESCSCLKRSPYPLRITFSIKTEYGYNIINDRLLNKANVSKDNKKRNQEEVNTIYQP